jgi:hypothetical protein
MNPLVLIVSFITIACSHNENDRSSISKDNIVAESPSIFTFDTLQITNKIKKQFAEINANAAKYDKIEKDLPGQSAEGGVMIAFYEKEKLKKVVTTFYGETGKATTEYYFNTEGLFFIFKKNYFYDKPMYIEGSKVASTEEWRYYFFNNYLLKLLDNNNKPVNPNSKKYQEENKYMKEDLEMIKKAIGDYKPIDNKTLPGDTVRCKYSEKCPDTGYIIKGSRDANGWVIHVNPKNKKVPSEK